MMFGKRGWTPFHGLLIVSPVVLVALGFLVRWVDRRDDVGAPVTESVTPPMVELKTVSDSRQSGVGINVVDLDGDGIPEIIIVDSRGIRIYANPLPQK